MQKLKSSVISTKIKIDKMESTIWQELKKRQALKELVLDSIDVRLVKLIHRVDLRSIGGKEICVIVFHHPLALNEWKREQTATIERMRELYKQRKLKKVVVFHKVLTEVSYQPIPLEREAKESTYKEQSSGEFIIQAQDEIIQAYFKAIQAAIKENLSKESNGNTHSTTRK